MEAHGLATCQVQIGHKVYVQRFIVCNKMMTHIIIGRDFLSTYKLNIIWGDEGTMEVLEEGMEVARMLGGVCHYPTVTIKWTRVPPRAVASVPVMVNLPPFGEKTLFHFAPLQDSLDLGENALIYPVDYATWREGYQQAIQTIVNLSESVLTLAEETPLGYFKRESGENILIDQEGLFEVNVKHPWGEGELEDKLFPPGGDGFIVSSADVDPHPPARLKDVDISPEQRKAFEELCKEFSDVFFQDSGDLGKTPLMKMEIPTGDNPPMSQWPYGLALKHVQWVQEEIETLGKARVIAKSISPWASPIVIVPKKTSPGEPPRRRMCVDYRMLNSLLPKVEKAHTKAKGVLTLVPIPKIDEIYA